MFPRFVLLIAPALVLALAAGTQVSADESGELSGGQPDSKPEIASIVRDLAAERFAVREAASRQLHRQGKNAIPALAESARSSDAEVRGRSIDLLERLFKSGDSETRVAAEAALREIADSDQPSAANLAKQALQPEAVAGTPIARRFPIQGQIIQGGVIQGGIIQGAFAPARLQIQVQANAGQARRVNIRQTNKVRDIEVQEGDRKVKIHDDPDQGITVEVTDKKDGKEKTEKYEAKNADELKKNHPEGHKIYEQYNQQIQLNGGRAIPQIAPAPNAQAPNAQAPNAQAPNARVPVPVLPQLPGAGNDEAARLDAHIKELKKANLPPDSPVARQIERLEEMRDRLRKLPPTLPNPLP